MRSHARLTLTAAVGVLAWSVHFALQDAWTAAALLALTSARVALGVRVVNWPSRARWWATACGWALTAVLAKLTWAGWESLPATVASMFAVWAGFHLTYRPLRTALLGIEAIWLVNAVLLQSWTAILGALAAMAVNLTMMATEADAGRAGRWAAWRFFTKPPLTTSKAAITGNAPFASAPLDNASADSVNRSADEVA